MKRLFLLVLSVVFISSIGFATYYVSAGNNQPNTVKSASSDDNNLPNNATVSFGGWMTTPPLSRFPNLNPITANHHALTPKMAQIRVGGTVNFIIGGFHHVLVYDDGTQPEDIDKTVTVPPTNGGPPLINDPRRRIYRGLDPSLQPQDRVEVVQFDRPGTYFVMCGVLPHFNDGMYGFIQVVPNHEHGNESDHEHGNHE